VAGGAYTALNQDHAFRWTNGTMTDLGTLGGANSVAGPISSDGSVLAGYADTAENQQHAFRWTIGTGMVDLGTLIGTTRSLPIAISSDGTTVVGYADNGNGTQSQAFLWTQSTGMQSVATWLANAGVTVPAGWVLRNAYGVNQDGTVIVGDAIDANGTTQAYLAQVGSGTTTTGRKHQIK
jgi:probable HAF family extracellular repeat protein